MEFLQISAFVLFLLQEETEEIQGKGTQEFGDMVQRTQEVGDTDTNQTLKSQEAGDTNQTTKETVEVGDTQPKQTVNRLCWCCQQLKK